jgi:hypothetical protein
MFVPELDGEFSIENGRSEFQHPKRSLNDYFPEIDRFSIWVIVSALEAIKIDRTLWHAVMQGGFNTLDNFLFTIQDFSNTNQSKLFKRLYDLKSKKLDFYLDNLVMFCKGEISDVTSPILFDNYFNLNDSSRNLDVRDEILKSLNHRIVKKSNLFDGFEIVAIDCEAIVLTSTLQKLGNTPMFLEKGIFSGKIILVSNGTQTKRIYLENHRDLIVVDFAN